MKKLKSLICILGVVIMMSSINGCFFGGKDPDELRGDMLKFVIGTMGDLDAPLTPSAKGGRSFMAYMCNLTEEDFQKERDEVLATDVEVIRSLAPIIESIMKQDYLCTVGNEDTIRKAGSLFDEVKSLIK